MAFGEVVASAQGIDFSGAWRVISEFSDGNAVGLNCEQHH